jgi:hypothetical protein
MIAGGRQSVAVSQYVITFISGVSDVSLSFMIWLSELIEVTLGLNALRPEAARRNLTTGNLEHFVFYAGLIIEKHCGI